MWIQTYGLLVHMMDRDLAAGIPQAERPSLFSSAWNATATRIVIASASLLLALMLAGTVVAGITNSGVIGVA